jgi:hypothetical protein
MRQCSGCSDDFGNMWVTRTSWGHAWFWFISSTRLPPVTGVVKALSSFWALDYLDISNNIFFCFVLWNGLVDDYVDGWAYSSLGGASQHGVQLTVLKDTTQLYKSQYCHGFMWCIMWGSIGKLVSASDYMHFFNSWTIYFWYLQYLHLRILFLWSSRCSRST